MRKLFYILSLLLLYSSSVFSQVFELELFTDTLVKGRPGNEIEIKGDLINKTESPITITITRLENNIPADWTTLISTDVCLPHYLSINNVTIPGLSKQAFSFHFVTSAAHNDQGNALLEFTNSADPELILLHRFYCITDSTLVSVNSFSSSDKMNISVFPNPNDGRFFLNYTAQTQEDIKLSVFSLSGKQIIKSTAFKVHAGSNLIALNYPLSSGTYVLLISASEKASYHPLIIIK